MRFRTHTIHQRPHLFYKTCLACLIIIFPRLACAGGEGITTHTLLQPSVTQPVEATSMMEWKEMGFPDLIVKSMTDPAFWIMPIDHLKYDHPKYTWILTSGEGTYPVYTMLPMTLSLPLIFGHIPVSIQVHYTQANTINAIRVYVWTKGDSKNTSFNQVYENCQKFFDICNTQTLPSKPLTKTLSSRISFKGQEFHIQDTLWQFFIEQDAFIRLNIIPAASSKNVSHSLPNLHFNPESNADLKSSAKSELRDTLRECVKKRANQDLVISGIPMINQGDKGYCVPATCARVLQFYGLDTDEHELAHIMETSAHKGTHITEVKSSLKKLSSGLPVFTKQISFVPGRIENYIEKGIPLVWLIPGHCRLIFGINKKDKYVLYSDSWGIRGLEEKMSFEEADKITQFLFALK